jgi:hypothetical protein
VAALRSTLRPRTRPDASVVLKWFQADGERHVDAARALRATYETGQLAVVAPPLLRLEIVNVAGRHWQFGEDAPAELAVALDELGFDGFAYLPAASSLLGGEALRRVDSGPIPSMR